MRLTKKVLSHDKTYVGILRAPRDFDADALGRAIAQLSGQVFNVPPEISAVKIQVRSRKMENRLIDVDGRDAVVEVVCEAGTYIRTLARDLGLLLGHPVELKELRRTKSGRFTEPQSITLQDLKDAFWLWREKGEEVAMRRILSPIEALVTELPEIIVKDGAAGAIAHGAPLMRPGIVSIAADLERGDTVRLMTMKGELVALASMLTRSEMISEMNEGEVARPESVFLPSEVYPRAWKKKKNPSD
jgi:H/ACA ribonucleoprotein complex subunit 4